MSTETKWTPGPWRSVMAQRGFVVVSHDDTYDIAVVRDIGNENNEANANLIASAPELYEALEAICAADQNEELCDAHFITARDALKKSRGE